MPTLVLRAAVESSESLARRLLTEVEASWSTTQRVLEYLTVSQGVTTNLPSGYATYVLTADPVSGMIIGWVFNANTVEMPINGVSVVNPPATPYVRNPNGVGTNPVPVKMLAFY